MNATRNILAVTLAAIMLAGCSSTSQPGRSTTLGEEKESGFLGDLYPKMHDGKDGEALRLYVNPAFSNPAQFSHYTKILLDPVQLYAGPDSKLLATPQEENAAIAQSFQQVLKEQLAKDYQIVTQPGPDTLRISIAIVDAEAANTTLKAVSYIPVPLGLPGAKLAVMQGIDHTAGKPPFSGDISIEGKMNDAQNGDLIVAGIDRRAGARQPIIGLFESRTYDSWSDVKEAQRYWAERFRYRLCMRRAASNCVAAVE